MGADETQHSSLVNILEVLDSLLHDLSKVLLGLCASFSSPPLSANVLGSCLPERQGPHKLLERGAIFCQNGKHDISVTDVGAIEDGQQCSTHRVRHPASMVWVSHQPQ